MTYTLVYLDEVAYTRKFSTSKLMHDLDDTVSYEYCCRVQGSALCSGDCVVDKVSVFQ